MHKSTIQHSIVSRCLRSATAVTALACLCGCVGLRQQQRSQDMRRQLEYDRISGDIQRIERQVDEMSQGRQGLYSSMEQVESSVAANQQSMQEQIDAINKRLSVLESSQVGLRKEIVDDLTKRLDGILKNVAPASTVRTEEGYEHTVQSGETLSEIASAYNVAVEVIVRANNLKNPNAIRVGQKLFIPE